MEIKQKSLAFQTRTHIETRDITAQVSGFVRESGCSEGLLFVYCPHSTAAVFLNENEPGLQRDILGLIKRLVPPSEHYQHNAIDDNAAAHLAAILVGNCVAIPVANSALATGTWQRVFLLELDGPRRRTVNIVLLGD